MTINYYTLYVRCMELQNTSHLNNKITTNGMSTNKSEGGINQGQGGHVHMEGIYSVASCSRKFLMNSSFLIFEDLIEVNSQDI